VLLVDEGGAQTARRDERLTYSRRALVCRRVRTSSSTRSPPTWDGRSGGTLTPRRCGPIRRPATRSSRSSATRSRAAGACRPRPTTPRMPRLPGRPLARRHPADEFCTRRSASPAPGIRPMSSTVITTRRAAGQLRAIGADRVRGQADRGRRRAPPDRRAVGVGRPDKLDAQPPRYCAHHPPLARSPGARSERSSQRPGRRHEGGVME
jgi:hypothetical protein